MTGMPPSPEEKRRRQREATARYAAKHRDKVLANKRRWHATWTKEHGEEKRQRDALYRQAHREQVRTGIRRWASLHPEKKKQSDTRWRKANPEKVAQSRARYERAHPEKMREKHARYKAKHLADHAVNEARRRARKRHAPINDLTPKIWAAIKAHYNYRCVYCGKKMQRLTQDHITPLIKGGNHTLANVVPACRSCNSKKGSRAVLKAIQPLLLVGEVP